MKSILRPFLALLFCCGLLKLSAQNALPSVQITSLFADTANHFVQIGYDLVDAEGDDMDIWIQVSADSGRTWRVAIDSLAGDHGFPIQQGTGKSLTWHYRPATLSAYGAGLANYRIRLIADDRQTIDLQTVTDMVDSTRLHQDLLALEGLRHRSTGLVKLEATKDSLEALMTQNDLHPYRQGSTFTTYTCENLIGRRSGTRNDSACWQISSHFDTVNNAPGADDNATAVACVSEAIRVLSNFNTKESLKFFYFDLEEAGLIGSMQYINSAVPEWETPKGLLNMDCVGYYNELPNSQSLPTGFNLLFPAVYNAVQADSFRGNFLTSIVNTASSWLDTVFTSTVVAHVPTLKVISLETPGTGTLTSDLRRSDHAPFWDAGYPAIFFSDGANLRNPNYHTQNDVVSTLNMDFYVKNVRAIVTTLARLAQLEHSTIADAGGFDVLVPVGIQKPQILAQGPGLQVLPNPSNGRVEAIMKLEVATDSRLELRDHHGRLLQVLQEGWQDAGSHSLIWDCNWTSGNYALILITAQGRAYQPLVIQR